MTPEENEARMRAIVRLYQSLQSYRALNSCRVLDLCTLQDFVEFCRMYQ